MWGIDVYNLLIIMTKESGVLMCGIEMCAVWLGVTLNMDDLIAWD